MAKRAGSPIPLYMRPAFRYHWQSALKRKVLKGGGKAMRHMLKIGSRGLAAAAVAVATFGVSFAAEAGEVRVTINDVEARGGHLLATLQTEDTFMRGRGAHATMIASPDAPGPITFVFTDVAPGEYALSVMHDANDNQQMDMLANGMPAEGWAMSNGSRLTGPPTFGVVKFTVGAEPVTITEHISYPWVPPGQ